mmetsp:Transcript_2999/g.6040  ORF Transcript_2999/g.6040 Transcript_2999/m.6040 type:complete len:121 (+) Transcript_2999:721-1083(+)
MGGTAAGAVEMPMDGFVTKPDPGVGCRDPVHPVVGVCVHKTKDDGEPEELWLEHNNFYSDEGHCTSDGGGSSDGTRRLAATTTTTTTTTQTPTTPQRGYFPIRLAWQPDTTRTGRRSVRC